jgi:hypothetical protein
MPRGGFVFEQAINGVVKKGHEFTTTVFSCITQNEKKKKNEVMG